MAACCDPGKVESELSRCRYLRARLERWVADNANCSSVIRVRFNHGGNTLLKKRKLSWWLCWCKSVRVLAPKPPRQIEHEFQVLLGELIEECDWLAASVPASRSALSEGTPLYSHPVIS